MIARIVSWLCGSKPPATTSECDELAEAFRQAFEEMLEQRY